MESLVLEQDGKIVALVYPDYLPMVAEITYRSMTASKKKAPISFFNSRLISVISIALALYMMGLFFIFGLISKELSV